LQQLSKLISQHLNILLNKFQRILCFTRSKFTNYPSGLSVSNSSSSQLIDLNQEIQFTEKETFYSIVSICEDSNKKYQLFHVILSSNGVSINSSHSIVCQYPTKLSDISRRLTELKLIRRENCRVLLINEQHLISKILNSNDSFSTFVSTKSILCFDTNQTTPISMVEYCHFNFIRVDEAGKIICHKNPFIMKVEPYEKISSLKGRIAWELHLQPSQLRLFIEENSFQPLNECKSFQHYFPHYSPTQSIFIYEADE
jgi:hypothetical protein